MCYQRIAVLAIIGCNGAYVGGISPVAIALKGDINRELPVHMRVID